MSKKKLTIPGSCASHYKLVNLTPHGVTIHTDWGIFVEPPSGRVARVKEAVSEVGTINCTGGDSEACHGLPIPVLSRTKGAVEGLPERTLDGDGWRTIYIVSGMVAAAAPRADVFSPGPLVRD